MQAPCRGIHVDVVALSRPCSRKSVKSKVSRHDLFRRLVSYAVALHVDCFTAPRIRHPTRRGSGMPRAAAPACRMPHLDLDVNARWPARRIPTATYAPIVEARLHTTAGRARGVCERRTGRTTRTPGSPTIPTTAWRGRSPGKRYESERHRRGLEAGISEPWQVFVSQERYVQRRVRGVSASSTPRTQPHKSAMSPFLRASEPVQPGELRSTVLEKP
jgi:hypothetical protein